MTADDEDGDLIGFLKDLTPRSDRANIKNKDGVPLLSLVIRAFYHNTAYTIDYQIRMINNNYEYMVGQMQVMSYISDTEHT